MLNYCKVSDRATPLGHRHGTIEQPGMFIQSRLVPSPSLDPCHRNEIADNAVEMLGVTFIWTSRSRRAGSGRRAPSGALHQTRSPWRRLVSRRDHFVALTEKQTRSAIGETSPATHCRETEVATKETCSESR